MSTWKNEIIKALQTMDAFLCYITKDFYESEWTNQEVGFAIAKGVPIYLYSADGTDPKGFKLDIQAFKGRDMELLFYRMIEDFSNNDKFKKNLIENFIDSRDGTFDKAKRQFCALIMIPDSKLNDQEIERIVDAFSAKAQHVNQLLPILFDPVKPEHKNHPKLRHCKFYHEYLENILKCHTSKRYSVIENEGRFLIAQE